MYDSVLSFGKRIKKSRSGHRGSPPRAYALLLTGLIAVGLAQLPTSAVAAPAMRTQTPSVAEAGLRPPVADPPTRDPRGFRPRLSVRGDTVFAGDDVRFELRLSRPSRQFVFVRFATQDGSAQRGGDYQAVAGSRFFRPGTTRASVFVRTFENQFRDRDLTFSLVLFQVRGAILVNSRAQATILSLNNDPCQPFGCDPCEPFGCDPPCNPFGCDPPCHPFGCDPPDAQLPSTHGLLLPEVRHTGSASTTGYLTR